jgi:hypothetical protein
MCDQERAAIRQADADEARRSRARQGLPERIEDPAAVAVLAAILCDARAAAKRKLRKETSSINRKRRRLRRLVSAARPEYVPRSR